MSKKLVSAALTATTLVWMVGASVLPVAANAQSTSNIQAQIQALLSQISALQSQLGGSGSVSATTGTSMPAYSFTKDLTVGSTGADVSALQQLLINKGYLTAVSAPTGYFGSLTQKAVAAFQAANGISPAAGYFGPKTRAFVNSMSVGTTTTTTTTTGGGGTTTTTTAPASGLSVSLASDNPMSGSLVSGAARIPVLAMNFTAGNSGAITITGASFHKTGVVSDSTISGAYLTMNGQVVAQYNSINQGVISFSGMQLSVPAGQTVELQLAVDTSGGSAGNTVGFSLNSMSDISAMDTNNNAVTPNGAFPLNGGTFTFTTVSNPSLATLTITSSSIGNQVTAGTQGNLVGAWNFSVQNSKLWLKGINFRVIGSANKSDLQNVKLMINGTQVGATLASVNQNGTAYFDASAAPGVLNTGSNNVQVFADVMGSPSYNFQFEILNSYDVLAVDSQYNVPITVTNTSGTGTQVSIQQGQITVTQDSTTPTGNIAKGQSQITLAKFDIYAAGEAVRVKYLGFDLAFTGVATSTNATTLSQMIRNVSLVDDAGGQVGSTINTPPSSNTCDNSGSPAGLSSGTITASAVTYVDCFGTSGSPINYVVPANTTRVLSLKADIQSAASFSTVTAALIGNTSNLQGLTSSQVGSSGAANGSAISLANSSLTAAANNALGSQNVSAGVTGQRIGSYSLTASTAEGVNVSNLSIVANGSNFQNLKAMVNGAQFGTTVGTVSSGTTYTFSGTPFNIPAGSTVNVDVYADTLSSGSGTVSPATVLSGLSGTGQVSFSAISLSPSSVNGQNLSFGSAPSISVSADSTQAPTGQIVMGSTGNSLASFRFTETSNVENVKITDLNVIDAIATSSGNDKAAFSNLTLWNGSTALGTANVAANTQAATSTVTISGTATATGTYAITVNGVTVTSAATVATDTTGIGEATALAGATYPTGFSATSSGTNVVTITGPAGSPVTLAGTASQHGNTLTFANNTGGYLYAFHFANPVIVPQANSVSLTLKGDAASYASSGATDNSAHQFEIVTTGDSSNNTSTLAVKALGATSNKSAGVTISSANGNTQTVLRSILTASVAPLGGSNHSKSNPDDIGTVTLSANSAGPVALNTLAVTFTGSAATSSLFAATSTFSLIDQNGLDAVAAGEALSVATSGTYVVTWTFPSGHSGFQISAGGSYTFKVRLNTTVVGAVANTSESLSANLQTASAVAYTDGLDTAATTGLNLPSASVPLTINSVTYPVGN